jgi:alpha-mannosidase
VNGVPFRLGSSAPGARNVLVPSGQALPLPRGAHNRVYLLAAASGGDVSTTLDFIGAPPDRARHTIQVREWQAPIGQWHSTIKTERMLRQVIVPEMQRQTWSERAIADDMLTSFDPATGAVSGIDQIRPAFVKSDEIAWVGTHRHDPSGNQIYIPSYVFIYAVDVPDGTTAIRLPDNRQTRIFAMTAVRESAPAVPSRPLYMPEIPRR